MKKSEIRKNIGWHCPDRSLTERYLGWEKDEFDDPNIEAFLAELEEIRGKFSRVRNYPDFNLKLAKQKYDKLNLCHSILGFAYRHMMEHCFGEIKRLRKLIKQALDEKQ